MSKTTEDTLDLSRLFLPLLRWWYLIVASALLAAITSFLVVRQEPTLYQSNTTLMIGRPFESLNPDTSQLWLSQTLAQTYAGFAHREPVQLATMAALGLEWLPQYSAYVPPQTQFVEIAVVDTDPSRAQAVAAELANQLIQLSPSGEANEEQQRQFFINQQLDELQTQIEDTKNEIEVKQLELGALFSAREIADAQVQIQALQEKLNTLQLNYATLLSSSDRQATNALTIIEPAALPETPVDSRQELKILLATAFGVSLAIAAAHVLEFLNDSIQAEADVARVTDAPLLAEIPQTHFDKEVFVGDHPRAPATEAYRHLRTSLRFSNMDREAKVVVISSALSSEGKSKTAGNLALVMAQAGLNVLLVDADLRKPRQHQHFQLRQQLGLSGLLLAMKNVDDNDERHEIIQRYVQQVPGQSLSVLTSGVQPPNPAEILGSGSMLQLLTDLSEMYDQVIIDTPPTLVVTDAATLAHQADAVLLVVRAGKTRRRNLRQTVNRLREIGAPLAGLVLNGVNIRQTSGFYYYNNDYVTGEPQAQTSQPDYTGPDRGAEMGAPEVLVENLSD